MLRNIISAILPKAFAEVSGGGTSASSKSGKGTSSAQKLGSRIIPASRSTKNGGK